MSQRRDSLRQITSVAFSIKAWLEIRHVHQPELPTSFLWTHLWEKEEFLRLRMICANHFGLDLSVAGNQSEFLDFHFPFLVYFYCL
jgi:hypothetical protein